MSDEKPPIAENEAPKKVEQVSGQEAPLTQEEFAAEMQQLTERARAAGLNPIRPIAHSYLKQGMIALEGLLTSLENADNSTKKRA